jgi:hypothetical protein
LEQQFDESPWTGPAKLDEDRNCNRAFRSKV